MILAQEVDLERTGGIFGYSARFHLHECMYRFADTTPPLPCLPIKDVQCRGNLLYLYRAAARLTYECTYDESYFCDCCGHECPFLRRQLAA